MKKYILNDNTASQQAVKKSNMKLLFTLISEREPISRAELKNITKLSATTVSTLVDELMQDNLVKEIGMGESSTSGRKPIMLTINAEGGYFVSVEILKEYIKYSRRL